MTFDAFLRRRGFDPDGPVLKRMFVDCWAEPTFRGFWRVWNPLYGYVLLRLYLALGGSERRAFASAVVFLACGWLLHDLPMSFVLGTPQLGTTAAFASWWAMVVLSSRPAPSRARAVVGNAVRILLGLAIGIAAQSAFEMVR